ncbi:MAG TPA: hypothetical protein PKA16_00430 [Ottowia sp.]|uniref:hypothetical protein n=1 Tax=Ottowia sp. TaxID=1898956 RepID=UPI002C5695E3|nr:hypothetical protein [Ottowia sp.]HMN19838.1 hypothetical protein [Ottowia sp.]
MNYTVNQPARKGGLFLLDLAAVSLLVACVWLLFRPALPGIVQFDDRSNLSGLATIGDMDSARRWIGEGIAGPLGRPLALASFALQFYQWPDPAPFLRWNIALHQINALLVLWLAVLASGRLGYVRTRQVSVGFLGALTWAALPLLNTSVLFIVQRMTLLSTTFMLAGLIAFLKLRGPAAAPWWRQALATGALATFGVLAALAKESGALIVVYGLLLELLVWRQSERLKPTPAALALAFASALLLTALLRYAAWGECTVLQRGFDVWERLGSQGYLLLLYLKGLFLPVGHELNPFRLQHMLSGSEGTRWSGVVLWFSLMLAPPALWLRGWRLVALALAWFCWGHIMESGWVALEPYFAHRNYLPAIGPVFALTAWVFARSSATIAWRGAFVAYVLVLATVSWMNTSLWGNRLLAGEIWASQEPRNTRAALNLAYELERSQGLPAAQHYLDGFVKQGRDSPGLRLQGLVSACVMNPSADHSALVADTVHAIATLPYEGWATDQVEKLLDVTRKTDCQGVSVDQVALIASAFLAQPAYQCNAAAVHNMLSVLGFAALGQGQTGEALDFFGQALGKSVSYGIAGLYLDLAQNQGDLESIRRLQALVTTSATPRGATPAEWQALRDRVAAALPPSHSLVPVD